MPAVFGTYDQAGLDAQYNNRARVPDHGRYFTRWRELSLAARQRPGGRLGLAYGSGERERLDLFPATQRGAPTLLFFHGGYWQALDRSDFSYLAPAWVAAGVSVAVASYPLAPATSMDEIAAACARAAHWVQAHAADWQGSAARIYAAGHSAGGHLVALLMASEPAGVAGGIAVSGLFELEPIRLSYLNATLRLDREAARRLSPLLKPHAHGPLLFAVGGQESEEFLRQTNDMADSWKRRGEPAEALVMPGLDHFSAIDALADSEHPLFQKGLRLVTGAVRGM